MVRQLVEWLTHEPTQILYKNINSLTNRLQIRLIPEHVGAYPVHTKALLTHLQIPKMEFLEIYPKCLE